MEFSHKSVLLNECIEQLHIKKDGIYVDGTAGGGGHSSEIATLLGKNGLLIAIDQDDDAIKVLKERLNQFGKNALVIKSNFEDTDKILTELNIEKIDGFLLDLGVSSYQLDNRERGFSYMNDAVLDMRMDKAKEKSAKTVVNEYSFEKLREIFWEYGEEKFSSNIAKKIVNYRQKKSIETTVELSEIIKSAMPSFSKKESQHPAKRTFQAIRIEVNDELAVLKNLLLKVISFMKQDGRIAIITFHSLEDRLVKTAFTQLATACVCPKDFPVCVCGNKSKIQIITKKPIVPTDEEIEQNPRARSAKLRVARVL